MTTDGFGNGNEASLSRPVGCCSFCHKTSQAAGPLVRGPNEIYICYACAKRSLEQIEEHYQQRGLNFVGVANDKYWNARRQMDSLVNDIQQLSTCDVSEHDFYREFLRRIVACLAAVGGAVWKLDEKHELVLLSGVNFDTFGFDNDAQRQARHCRLLKRVYEAGVDQIAPPLSESSHGASGGDNSIADNPTGCLLLFSLLKAGDSKVGLVEVFQRYETPPQPPNVLRGYLRFLARVCLFANYFNVKAGRRPSAL